MTAGKNGRLREELMATGHRLIVGCGYFGSRVARRWRADGHTVWAVTRSAERAAAYVKLGWRPVVADITEPTTLTELPACETILFAVGFDRTRYTDMRSVYVEGLKRLITH